MGKANAETPFHPLAPRPPGGALHGERSACVQGRGGAVLCTLYREGLQGMKTGWSGT